MCKFQVFGCFRSGSADPAHIVAAVTGWRLHWAHTALYYMYLNRTNPNKFMYKYLEFDRAGIYMFTHVD